MEGKIWGDTEQEDEAAATRPCFPRQGDTRSTLAAGFGVTDNSQIALPDRKGPSEGV